MRMHQPINWQGRTLLKRYRLLQLLGRGSVGEVWLAEDSATQQQVAIKLLPTALTVDQQYRQAFAEEVRAAAALRHPQILPIHNFGEEALEGDQVVPFLVMPYLAEGSLHDHMRTVHGLLPVKESLHYLKEAAQAIDYAHSQGVLHRDIKPANMLLHQQSIFLTDFGLAKILIGTPQHSPANTAIGTAEYMAPEQARGQTVPASDLYSLAMIAYQLFTGILPFKGETPYAILMQQISRTVPPPRQINPLIPQEVAEALTKGLEKQPAQRFSSCTAFVDALEKGWQTFIAPMTDPEATVVAPWSKRHPYNQSTMPIPQATDPDAPAHSPIPPAQPAPAPVPPPSTPVQPLAATTSHAAVNSPQATLSQSAPSLNNGNPAQGTLSAARPPLTTAPRVNRRVLLLGGAVVAVAGAGAVAATILFSRTQEPARQQNTPPTASQGPGPQKLMPGLPLLSFTAHTDKVWVATWDPTGHYLASAGDDTWVMLWDVTGALQKKPDQHQNVSAPLNRWKFNNSFLNNSLSWSPDGRKLIATPSTEDKIYLIEPLKKGAHFLEYQDRARSSDSLPPSYGNGAWAPQGRTFASTITFQNDLLLWQDGQVNGPTETFHYDPSRPTAPGFTGLAWSMDGKYIAALTTAATVVVWETATRKVIHELVLSTQETSTRTALRNALQWSPAEPHKLLVSTTDVATVWDAVENRLLLSLSTDDPEPLTRPSPNPSGWQPHTNGLCWSPNGKYIAGCYGRSSKIYIWDTQNTTTARTNAKGIRMQSMIFGEKGGHSNTLIDIAWSPDGRYLATTSFDKTVIVWKVDAA